jgi:hypothetical protein
MLELRQLRLQFSIRQSVSGKKTSAAEVLWLYVNVDWIIFELCRRTQQPRLTFHLVGGSTFGLWPLEMGDNGRK